MPSLAGRRVAVIGGTGFIGSHLTQRLVGEGADVLVVARSAARVDRLDAVRTECVIALADISDGEMMIRLFRRFRPEIVYLLASHPDGSESFAQIADCIRVNGIGVTNVLQASVAAGAEVLVYGDSTKDYGNSAVPYRAAQVPTPVCSYAIMKTAGWQLCQLVSSFAPIHTVALRPTLVYGPGQEHNVITYARDCVTSGRPVRLMGGRQTRDPLYIDDAVSAFVAAATDPRARGHAIPIGGGQELSVISLCEAVVAALGANVPVLGGAETARLTEIWRSSADNMDAHQLLGWEPRVNLAEGLKQTMADWVTGGRATQRSAAAPRAVPDTYPSTLPSGVYSMLDRRSGTERRAVPRGGRRTGDPVPLAAAGAFSATALHSPFYRFRSTEGNRA